MLSQEEEGRTSFPGCHWREFWRYPSSLSSYVIPKQASRSSRLPPLIRWTACTSMNEPAWSIVLFLLPVGLSIYLRCQLGMTRGRGPKKTTASSHERWTPWTDERAWTSQPAPYISPRTSMISMVDENILFTWMPLLWLGEQRRKVHRKLNARKGAHPSTIPTSGGLTSEFSWDLG